MYQSLPLTLPFLRLTLPTSLPSSALGNFASATFRGGMGCALRRITCDDGRRACVVCDMATECLFARCFDKTEGGGVPRPFTLRAIEIDKKLCAALTLFGEAAKRAETFVRAFSELGRMGIGKDNLLFSVRGEGTAGSGAGTKPQMLALVPGKPSRGEIALSLLTPLSLRMGGAVLDRFEAQVFLNLLLKRVESLGRAYGDFSWDKPTLAAIREAVATIRVLADSTQWRRFTRTSTRQGRTIDYYGIIGDVTLKGDIGTIMPLLKAGEIVGAGRDTTVGFGAYRIENGKQRPSKDSMHD